MDETDEFKYLKPGVGKRVSDIFADTSQDEHRRAIAEEFRRAAHQLAQMSNAEREKVRAEVSKRVSDILAHAQSRQGALLGQSTPVAPVVQQAFAGRLSAALEDEEGGMLITPAEILEGLRAAGLRLEEA